MVTLLSNQTLLTMRRSGLTLALLAIPLLAAGCAGYPYQVGVAYETIHPEARPASRYYNRLDRDVRGYVNHLDHRLRLNRRQEQRIRRLLQNRAYDLLERTARSEHARVYPFPRHEAGRAHPIARRWWQETDRRIESLLNRRQVRAYRALTHQGYDDDRYDDDRYDRRDRRDRRRGRYND